MRKLIFASLILLSVPLQGQNHPKSHRLGMSYVTNLPNEYIGFGIYFVNLDKRKLGGFLDVKLDVDPIEFDDDYYYDNISIYEAEIIWEDSYKGDFTSWASWNAGITITLTGKGIAYIGAGYTIKLIFREYHDDSRILGDNGDYWLLESSSNNINLLGGIIFYGKSAFFQIGLETMPKGLTLGIGFFL